MTGTPEPEERYVVRAGEADPYKNPNCPNCGVRIYRTHHCKAGPVKALPSYVRPMIAEGIEQATVRAQQQAAAQLQGRLDLGDPPACAGCGTTDRPLLAKGLCRPCLFALPPDQLNTPTPLRKVQP